MSDMIHRNKPAPRLTPGDELFIALQRLVPQHTLSRLAGRLTESRHPWLKNTLIRMAMSHYDIDLGEALVEEPYAYTTFNDFFTRRLKPDARPIASDSRALVAPADGLISQMTQIDDGTLVQAKGRYFSTAELLGFSRDICSRFDHGSFATIYLAPRDYHRVHMPVAGKLIKTRYIPGKLFSVNTVTANGIGNLFARNERLVCLFETGFGPMAVVLVGAMLVAGIETVWQKHFTPGHLEDKDYDGDLDLDRGEELGLFKFGSTVIVLTGGKIDWLASDNGNNNTGLGERERRGRVGESLGCFATA